MISDETNVLPAQLAAVIANGVQELKSKPLQPLIDALVERAERMYRLNREFRHGCQRDGARGRSYLQAFMRGWAAEWAREHYPHTPECSGCYRCLPGDNKTERGET